MCVCDMKEADAPIVYANDNFFTQTGYGPAEVIGRNCRFLQGDGTSAETVREMRKKLASGEEFVGMVLNYHKNGTTLREEAIKDGIPGEDFDNIVDPSKMISPG